MELSTILAFLIEWKYLGIFTGVSVGGEILLLVTGFFASLGFFKISLAIILAVLGTLVVDVFWYLLGRLGLKINFLRKIKNRINPEKTKKIKLEIEKHSIKTILLIRLIYGFRAMVLLIAGATKINFFNFIFINFIGTFIWASVFILLGYFFGQSILTLHRYIKNIILLIPLSVILISTVFILISFIKKGLVKKVNYTQKIPPVGDSKPSTGRDLNKTIDSNHHV